MSTKNKKMLQIFVICILLLSIFSVTGCITTEEKKEKVDDNGNGDNGNKTNGNGNGNNSTEEVIIFSEVHHEPETPMMGMNVQFLVTINSTYGLKKDQVMLIICIAGTTVCKSAKTMEQSTQNSKVYEYDLFLDPEKNEFDSETPYEYHITAKDTLNNDVSSDTYPFEID